jgi:hypothetical protein
LIKIRILIKIVSLFGENAIDGITICDIVNKNPIKNINNIKKQNMLTIKKNTFAKNKKTTYKK